MRSSKKGFTLLELLVVVTIIVILTGVVLPYVQQYVDDARFARCKADLDEIKSALALYETKRGEPYAPEASALLTNGGATSTAKLINRGYLTKNPVDPWGSPYAIYGASGTVMCLGPDGQKCTADDITVPFQPPLSCISAFWQDGNQDSEVSATGRSGDILILTFSRSVKSNPNGYTLGVNDVSLAGNDPDYAEHLDSSGKTLIFTFSAAPTFKAGQDVITLNPNAPGVNTANLLDNDNQPVKKDDVKILAR
jgi:general secretion pathway protein G